MFLCSVWSFYVEHFQKTYKRLNNAQYHSVWADKIDVNRSRVQFQLKGEWNYVRLRSIMLVHVFEILKIQWIEKKPVHRKQIKVEENMYLCSGLDFNSEKRYEKKTNWNWIFFIKLNHDGKRTQTWIEVQEQQKQQKQ